MACHIYGQWRYSWPSPLTMIFEKFALSTLNRFERLKQRVPTRALRNLSDRLFKADELSLAEQTPFEVVAEHDIVQLRYYPAVAGQPADKQPVVVVPPLAVNMLIYDLFPERSLVAFLRDQGHPLYLIDWGRPGLAQAHFRFHTYLQDFMPRMIQAVRAHSGQQTLSLHGWSIGAVFSYCYTALGDPDIDKLVLLGPPCDYHAAQGGAQNRIMSRRIKAIESATGWKVHKSRRELWHVPGWVNALGFKLMSPGGTMKGYMELLQNLDDRAYVAAHATNAAFLDDMVAYPGGFMQDLVRFLITDNVLAQGRLPIRDCEAKLDSVHAKVLIVVGDKDPIITPTASKRLIELMSSAQCQLIEVPGGHMSIVSGSAAPKKIWPHVAKFLGEP